MPMKPSHSHILTSFPLTIAELAAGFDQAFQTRQATPKPQKKHTALVRALARIDGEGPQSMVQNSKTSGQDTAQEFREGSARRSPSQNVAQSPPTQARDGSNRPFGLSSKPPPLTVDRGVGVTKPPDSSQLRTPTLALPVACTPLPAPLWRRTVYADTSEFSDSASAGALPAFSACLRSRNRLPRDSLRSCSRRSRRDIVLEGPPEPEPSSTSASMVADDAGPWSMEACGQPSRAEGGVHQGWRAFRGTSLRRTREQCAGPRNDVTLGTKACGTARSYWLWSTSRIRKEASRSGRQLYTTSTGQTLVRSHAQAEAASGAAGPRKLRGGIKASAGEAGGERSRTVP